MQKETACVHAGSYHDAATGGVNTPIFTSSSFEYLDRDEVLYPRLFNTPNQSAVVQKLCALEGAEDGLLFSSGMAAVSTTILALVSPGEHVVLLDAVYGGTHALATEEFDRLGIEYSFAETDVDAIMRSVNPKTRLIVVESPTNPLLGIVDLRRLAELASSRGITTVADNTFASPVSQNPLSLGIDVVLHSGTKYIGGHSDLCCGAALTSVDLAARIRATAHNLGGSVNAFTCSLIERSLKTLAVRVERQVQNAARIAEFLNAHSSVRTVNYPGLPDSPGHETAKSQMRGFGAMLSFELDSDDGPGAFLRRLQLITPALSLGGVESLICSPAETSHERMSPAERQRAGVTDDLLRLSVGIEHVDDLIADLSQAFAAP
jgi:cystathionine beta-lyase